MLITDKESVPLKLNDVVLFEIEGDFYKGTVRAILPDGRIKINALVGEFIYKPSFVCKFQH